VVVEGRKLLAFGGCNYLGLSHHAEVHAAVMAGLSEFGISTTASRETTGNTTVHEALERELAEYLGMEACIITPEGYSANLALAQALAREHQVAIVDEKSHRSVAHAVHAAGMQVNFYKHLDVDHAKRLVERHHGAGLVILTDGVFAADGAVAPVDELLAILPQDASKHVALVVDDCHGFCVLGHHGRGTSDFFLRPTGTDPAQAAVMDPRLIITTSLAKGLGCYGGAVAGRAELVRAVMEGSSVYRGTTPAPTPLVMAARESLRVMARESELHARLRSNTRRLHVGLENLGITLAKPATSASQHVPIFCFVLEPMDRMPAVERALRDEGFLAPMISYPGGPANEFFRWTVSASHSEEQIDQLLAALSRQIGAGRAERFGTPGVDGVSSEERGGGGGAAEAQMREVLAGMPKGAARIAALSAGVARACL
jgi:7-keto-8-aminopelargonate synthetase-like enzyme